MSGPICSILARVASEFVESTLWDFSGSRSIRYMFYREETISYPLETLFWVFCTIATFTVEYVICWVFNVHEGKFNLFIFVVVSVEVPWWLAFPTSSITRSSIGDSASYVTSATIGHPLYWLLKNGCTNLKAVLPVRYLSSRTIHPDYLAILRDLWSSWEIFLNSWAIFG